MLILAEGTTEYLIEATYSERQLRDMLGAGTVVLSFRKVSTEKDRVMYCTRKLDLIPKKDHPSGGPSRIPPGNLAVYDLIKKGWRSFRIHRVFKAEPKRLNFLQKLLRKRKYTMDKRGRPVSRVADFSQDTLGESFVPQEKLIVLECHELSGFEKFYREF